MTKLRPVELDFLETAPMRLAFEAVVLATPDRVFAALSDQPTTWTWFPGVKGLPYEGAAPFGVGTKRTVRALGNTYHETIVAWEAPDRWAYRVEETTMPIAKALVEEWTTSAAGEGTLVRWLFAADPGLVFRLASPILPFGMRFMFRRAMRNLGVALATSG
jgi:hypothetical protein